MFAVPHRYAVAPIPDRPVRADDRGGQRGQPDGHLRGGQEPIHENGQKRLRRQSGHFRPHVVSHHNAIDSH